VDGGTKKKTMKRKKKGRKRKREKGAKVNRNARILPISGHRKIHFGGGGKKVRKGEKEKKKRGDGPIAFLISIFPKYVGGRRGKKGGKKVQEKKRRRGKGGDKGRFPFTACRPHKKKKKGKKGGEELQSLKGFLRFAPLV